MDLLEKLGGQACGFKASHVPEKRSSPNVLEISVFLRMQVGRMRFLPAQIRELFLFRDGGAELPEFH